MTQRIRSAWLPPPVHLAALFAASGTAGLVATALTRQAGAGAVIWFSNGILLAALLSARPRAWPALLGAGSAAILAAKLAADTGLSLSLFTAANNAAEVLLAATLLRLHRDAVPDFTRPRDVLAFTVVGLVIAPAFAALDTTAIRDGLAGVLSDTAWHRFVANALGLAVMTPLTLALLRRDILLLFVPPLLTRTLQLLAGYALLVVLVFAQSRWPLLFLLFPPLLLVVSQLGFAGAGLAILITGVVAIGFTVEGFGPVMLITGAGAGERLDFVQVFLLAASGMAYPTGAAVAERRRLNQIVVDQHARMSKSERLYRLLADNVGDIITRATLNGRRLYVSPSVEAVLGWTPEELMRPDWMRLLHNDDIASFLATRKQLNDGAPNATNLYRIRRKDGGWAWMESRITVVRNKAGVPQELIATHRDVTKQKEMERALEAAMAELGEQAVTDGLTGIANRRQFDETLNKEWRRAVRNRESLAVLMIDADHFKQFNDRYGHLAGDDCLRAIAGRIAAGIRRPHDLAARYGGEEFAVILPSTRMEGATVIAQRLRASIEAIGMAHEASPVGVVSVSIGAACMVPEQDSEPGILVEAADTALYAAKHAGRNRVEMAALPTRSDTVVPFPQPGVRAVS